MKSHSIGHFACVEVVLRYFHPTRAACCGFFLLEGVLVSWSLGIDECGGHEDLHGLGRQSIIPYVHVRTELYYSSLTLPM
jgi:hypothetical protein